MWEKEKLLVASNFSFSHSVFKRLVSQGRQKVSLCGNGLTGYQTAEFFTCPKLEAFADDKIIVAETVISLCDGVENIVGKGENAEGQHFLLFPQCFQKPSLSGSLKVWIVW